MQIANSVKKKTMQMSCTKLHYLAFASKHSTGNFETIMFTIILIKINKSHKFTQGT